MSEEQKKRDFPPNMLTDFSKTPADGMAHRAMNNIAEETRRGVRFAIYLCLACMLTSVVSLLYQTTTWAQQRIQSRKKLDEILMRVRAHDGVFSQDAAVLTASDSGEAL